MKNPFDFFVTFKRPGLTSLSSQEYYDQFINGRTREEIQETYDRAWSAKNFEIDNYWKRAAYFWAFQVASFAGYFSVLGSSFYKENPEILYCVVCIGLVTSLAWHLINKGSKVWQRNWEHHVDLLENFVTGPLYKTVSVKVSFSVSKINDIVSLFFVSIWCILCLKFWTEKLTLNPADLPRLNLTVLFSSVAVALFVLAMFAGHGRGRFGEAKIGLYRRSVSVVEKQDSSVKSFKLKKPQTIWQKIKVYFVLDSGYKIRIKNHGTISYRDSAVTAELELDLRDPEIEASEEYLRVEALGSNAKEVSAGVKQLVLVRIRDHLRSKGWTIVSRETRT